MQFVLYRKAEMPIIIGISEETSISLFSIYRGMGPILNFPDNTTPSSVLGEGIIFFDYGEKP